MTPLPNRRPIRINLNLRSDIVAKSILQVLGMYDVQFVASEDEADLVIFDDTREIRRAIDSEKAYAYLLDYGEEEPDMPANVSAIPVAQALSRLLSIIADISKKLQLIDR
jgi:hypothetical protein